MEQKSATITSVLGKYIISCFFMSIINAYSKILIFETLPIPRKSFYPKFTEIFETVGSKISTDHRSQAYTNILI